MVAYLTNSAYCVQDNDSVYNRPDLRYQVKLNPSAAATVLKVLIAIPVFGVFVQLNSQNQIKNEIRYIESTSLLMTMVNNADPAPLPPTTTADAESELNQVNSDPLPQLVLGMSSLLLARSADPSVEDLNPIPKDKAESDHLLARLPERIALNSRATGLRKHLQVNQRIGIARDVLTLTIGLVLAALLLRSIFVTNQDTPPPSAPSPLEPVQSLSTEESSTYGDIEGGIEVMRGDYWDYCKDRWNDFLY